LPPRRAFRFGLAGAAVIFPSATDAALTTVRTRRFE
jgi:hypothetical protein